LLVKQVALTAFLSCARKYSTKWQKDPIASCKESLCRKEVGDDFYIILMKDGVKMKPRLEAWCTKGKGFSKDIQTCFFFQLN
jgi:hypothetical protein